MCAYGQEVWIGTCTCTVPKVVQFPELCRCMQEVAAPLSYQVRYVALSLCLKSLVVSVRSYLCVCVESNLPFSLHLECVWLQILYNVGFIVVFLYASPNTYNICIP